MAELYYNRQPIVDLLRTGGLHHFRNKFIVHCFCKASRDIHHPASGIFCTREDVDDRMKTISTGICSIKTQTGSETGFYIGNNLVLTCHHVMEGSFERQFRPSTGIVTLSAEAKFFLGDHLPTMVFKIPHVLAHSKEYDYAFVEVPGAKEAPLPKIRLNSPVNLGNAVHIIGFPDDHNTVFNIDCELNSYSQLQDDVLYYYCKMYEGSSGSPVFNRQCEAIALHQNGSWDNCENGRLHQFQCGTTIKPIMIHAKENFSHIPAIAEYFSSCQPVG